GNALEVKEAIDLLRGHGPADLEELSVCLTAHMLLLARKCSTYQQGSQQVQKILSSGAGFDKFCALVTAQEGRLDYQLPFYGLPQAKLQSDVQAAEDGYVAAIDAMEVGRAAMLLGAGRERLGDRIDPAVGIQVLKKHGDQVFTGEVIARIYANDARRMQTAVQSIQGCYHLQREKPPSQALILQTVR
ncbi:MAG: pyrimidine-nucleoside phosphorylase, partial [Firmicutes bacterium]|nr:pyrimidine-nucleoside phosphorylase [Bacillota bacterium]